ncbi:translation initiation factor eIF-2B epsilon [Babesia ovis]|uniref:Translation initiation factor eIF2B subunit epsilon n=1 Tax=Babesia ovis TaxID=5869 RepID=A0A9W5TD75_BABOV|nr:translation initiation factor eIF-2B epsilon [Babesia ovis]
MEAFLLVTEDRLVFEPLASAVPVCDLYVGEKSIFQETLENLWESGINKVTLVTTKYKVGTLEKYQKRYNFGRRQGHLDVEVLGLNVDNVLPGNVLRELTVVLDGLEEFIMLYWDTLITVPLSDALELHKSRCLESPNYAISVLYFEDGRDRKFSKPSDDCMMLLNGNSEVIAYCPRANKLRIDVDLMQKIKGDTTLVARYDLCESGIYICKKQVAEHFTNWYEHMEISDYINDCLTREFKTDEVYVTVLKPDLMFPNYPPALRIITPKDYYTVFMEYIKRFQQNEKPSNKSGVSAEARCGPMVHDRAIFCNNSAVVPPLGGAQNMLSAVSNSIIGKDFKVGENSVVDRCIVYDGVSIGNNCVVKDSIIMDGVTIEDGTVIPPGCIICSEVKITRNLVENVKDVLRVSRMPSRYIDLTRECDVDAHSTKEHDIYVWPITAFGNIEGTYIGNSFYDSVKFNIQCLSTESSSEEDSYDESYESSSDSDDESESGQLTDVNSDSNDGIDPEIAVELRSLVIGCLETPNQLPNKVLEIKSLKISHNLQKEHMVRQAFRDALDWIIERAKDENDLQELMETSQLREFVESFEHQIDEYSYYSEILEISSKWQKDSVFFSHLCEALYHTDIMEFDMLHDWLAKNNISGQRINSFADWLAED